MGRSPVPKLPPREGRRPMRDEILDLMVLDLPYSAGSRRQGDRGQQGPGQAVRIVVGR